MSWIAFAAAAALPGVPAALRDVVYLPGAIVPSLVALALTARESGRAGTLALLRRILQGPAGARWYVFAAGFMAVIELAVALVHRVVTGAWPSFGHEARYVMAGATLISTPVQAGEEVGWRGYALPRLAAHFGLAPASIVLGVIWACWHLPFFFIPGVDKTGQSFPVYLLEVSALSVAMAWLYWRTQGSLLAVMLMHAAMNNTMDIVPSAVGRTGSPFALSTSLVAWLTVAVLWVPAAYFLVRMRGADLPGSQRPATEAC